MKPKSGFDINILVLKIGGLWPENFKYDLKNIYTFYSAFCYVFIVMCYNLSQTINVYFIYDQMEAWTLSLLVMLTEISAMIKFFLFYKNIGVVKELMRILNGHIFQPKNKRQEDIIDGFVKIWIKFYVVFSISVMGSWLLWGLYPIIDGSYKNKHLPFLAWCPYATDISPNYELTYIYQFIANGFIAVVNQNVDTFISSLLLYIAIQSELLCDNFRILGNTPQEDIANGFVQCILHHKEILKFAKRANQFFSFIALYQFATSVISICMTMFQLTIVDFFTNEFNFLVCCQTAFFMQLLVYCWFGNQVIIKSDKISTSAYKSPFWFNARNGIKKDLVFFLMNTCLPINLRAADFFNLSLSTFTAILKTSWSYFALLQQFNDKN